MTVDFVTVLLTYLCVLMGVGAVLFFLHWLNEWRKPWQVSEESLLQCPDCHCAFIVRRRSNNGRCPRCEKLCQVRKKR